MKKEKTKTNRRNAKSPKNEMKRKVTQIKQVHEEEAISF